MVLHSPSSSVLRRALAPSSMAVSNFACLSLLILLPLSFFLILYLLLRLRPVKISLKDRHVFITGGSKGIGLALAHQAAREGARVSILARSVKDLEEAKKSIQISTGVKAAIFAADVRDYDAVKRAVEDAEAIDVLIVNQGVFVAQELEKQDVNVVKLILDVNLMGSFNVIKATLPGMKNRKDRRPASIALMSSQAGQAGIYGYTAYSASKFGLRGLAEALQQEVVRDNICVSLICPPDTETPGLEEDNKRRPMITKLIAASTNKMKADEVAKIALNGIKSGTFIIHCNIVVGFLLSVASAGLSPQRSLLMACVEVFGSGIARFLVLHMLWRVYRDIERVYAKNKLQ